MKKSLFQILILFSLFVGLPDSLTAQTGYVSDTLFLTFRDGPGESSAVIKRIKSDTPVSILEEQAEYYKVELESKEVGWVDKRFIIFETPKTMIIETLKQEKQALENKILDMGTQLQSIKTHISSGDNASVQKILELETSLKAEKDETEKINVSLSENKKKYDTLIEQSGNIQKIINENKELQEKNKTLSAELAAFKSKSTGFLNGDMIKWALFGVGVLMLGWIFGHSISVSKRRGGSSLLR
ncbi:MAG: TIGR04211 family SH3 domain-containing protein [Desulfobacula sp.]|jgi:SH3 domain protein